MIAGFRARRSAIEEALGRCGALVTDAGPTRWRVAVDPTSAPAIEVRWDDPWLAFEAAANGASPNGPDGAWLLLRAQRALPATCRYAAAARGRLRVVGDVLADGGADLAARCREVLVGLVAARTERPALPPPAPGAVPERARALVAEVDWSVHERPDGRLAGKLPGADRWSAELAGEPGRFRLSVEIAAMPAAGGATRLALGEMLLACGRLVRFARATIEEDGARCVLGFETLLPEDATSAELRHALSALAAACSVCGEETHALQDEAIAKEYLLVRGETP